MKAQFRLPILMGWMTLMLVSAVLLINAFSYDNIVGALLHHLSIVETPVHQNDLVSSVRNIFLVNLLGVLGVIVLCFGMIARLFYRYQKRMTRLAGYDALTGCMNRQAFDAVLATLEHSALRHNRDLSLILLDVDHFKQINDQHGHMAGDNVLRELVALMQQQIRNSDVVARWGGEEFIILLPDCNLDHAMRLAEALRQRIRHYDFSLKPNRTVTISAGVAQFTAGEGQAEQFRRLDDALYRAKREGRNRIVCAESAFSSPHISAKRDQ